MIGFHLDDTEWNEKENCLREESLYNTDKPFKPLNHNKIWIYNEKTGWRMEDKQEEELMNDDQWKRFKEVWESYGVKFTYDDGTYKSTYEILKQMSQVWKDLSNDEQEEIIQ